MENYKSKIHLSHSYLDDVKLGIWHERVTRVKQNFLGSLCWQDRPFSHTFILEVTLGSITIMIDDKAITFIGEYHD